MANEYFERDFNSAIRRTSKQKLRVSQLIKNNMIDEYFLREFSSLI